MLNIEISAYLATGIWRT